MLSVQRISTVDSFYLRSLGTGNYTPIGHFLVFRYEIALPEIGKIATMGDMSSTGRCSPLMAQQEFS